MDFSQTYKNPQLSDLKDIREWIKTSLNKIDQDIGFLTQEHYNEIILGISEILSNIILYPTEKATYLEISLLNENKKVKIIIFDDSAAHISFKQDMERSKYNHNIPNLEESGRGFFIINNIFSDIQYTEKNQISLKNEMILYYEQKK